MVPSLGQPSPSPFLSLPLFLSPVLFRKRVGFGDGKRVWNDGMIYLFVRSFNRSFVVSAGLLGSTCFVLFRFGLVLFGFILSVLVCFVLI